MPVCTYKKYLTAAPNCFIFLYKCAFSAGKYSKAYFKIKIKLEFESNAHNVHVIFCSGFATYNSVSQIAMLSKTFKMYNEKLILMKAANWWKTLSKFPETFRKPWGLEIRNKSNFD